MLKKILKLFSLSFAFLLLNSCENSISVENKNNVVEKKRALLIALNLNSKTNESSRGMIDSTKTILDTFTLKTTDNNDAMFVINYVEGGFAVLAADDRVSPILAYAEEGYFSINVDDMPDAVLAWLEEEKELIKYVKDENLTQNPEVKLEWDYVESKIPEPAGGSCEDTYVEKTPLLTTKWGQGATFNNQIPKNCPSSSGGKAPVGCVAVAMAQVMKYYNYPTNYNWSNMPNNYGTSDTQLLMKNIGSAVGMDYGCGGSSTTTSNAVVAFAGLFGSPGYFGYSNASYTENYNTQLIKQQRDWNKPVILCGGRKKNGISWNMYTGGHAWVTDGYRSIFVWDRDESGNCTGMGWGYLYLHMNWGWNGSYNGWYNAHNFNPSTLTFNYKRGIVYNINP
ncbi:C10 family peptidase [Flavobacterium sp.]|uniref:C10 family peptidase n=1 Tax=Flavobacterium sp. TaxID=239 RepID=UPI00261AE4FD|nr:C10 family peptidase [Flavobacterium sp.]